MDYIYADNSSTSFPKPQTVSESVANFIAHQGMNINRSSYAPAYDVANQIFDTREAMASLCNGPSPKHVIFTANVTTSLNIVLQGLFKSGDHLLTSSMEHNAVMRPLTYLSTQGITYDMLPCTDDGALVLDAIESAIKPNTKAIVMTHASNVCGTIMPLQEIGTICGKHNLLFIVDTAQTAGVLPIDMKAMHIDVLCFTGHKGLLGPQGIGGFIVTDEAADRMSPLLLGGTGSASHELVMPSFLPDKFEPGTLNLPGIIGLHAGLSYINANPKGSILEHELSLTERFLRGLKSIPSIHVHGKQDINDRLGVVSITSDKYDVSELAYTLESDYHILTRSGLHCAPVAHKTLGTYPTGTIRFSFGVFNTADEVDTILSSLAELHRLT